jgi:hypothetical protein
MEIRSNIIELNQSISGRIGFCGITDYGNKAIAPPFHHFDLGGFVNGMSYENLNSFQKLFIAIIDEKLFINCNYENIDKNFNVWEYGPKRSNFLYGYTYTPARGYIIIFDVKDRNNNWEMYLNGIEYFNKYFNCDYYLTGKTYLSYVENSGFEHNLYLVLYDNRGYKVWSKLYKKHYDYIEKNIKMDDLYFLYMKKLISDYKEEINNDLMFKKIVEVGK